MTQQPNITKALKALDLSQSEFARLVGITDRNVRRYVAGDVPVAGSVRTLLDLMIERPEIIAVLRDMKQGK